MKKLSIVLVLLLTVGLVGAFAVDFEPVVEFSSEVENTFGVDLNEEMSTGFDLSAEADLSVMFVDTTVEKGEGDVYGWIQVEDLELGAEIDEESDDDQSLTGSIGDINARVIFNPAYLQISTAPGFSYENAELLRLQPADDNDPYEWIGTNDLVDTNAGIIIGADGLADMVDVAFKIGSVDTYAKSAPAVGTAGYWLDNGGNIQGPVTTAAGVTTAEADATFGSWLTEYEAATTAGGNVDNEYAFGLDLTVTPMEMLSVSAGVVFSNVTDAGVGFTLNPVFTMDALEVGIPFDGYYGKQNKAVAGTDALDWEVAPYVTYDLSEDGTQVGVWSFMYGNTEGTGNMLLDVKAGAEEVSGGFVPGLEVSLYGYLFDVLDTQDSGASMGTGVEFHGAYDVNGIKPFVDVYWANTKDSNVQDGLDAAMLQDDDTTFDAPEEVMTLTAGVDLALIENTVFTLKYASDNLLDDTNNVYNSDGTTTGIDKGRITFSTTISY